MMTPLFSTSPVAQVAFFDSVLFQLAAPAAARFITAAVHHGLGGQGDGSIPAHKYSFRSGIPILVRRAFDGCRLPLVNLPS